MPKLLHVKTSPGNVKALRSGKQPPQSPKDDVKKADLFVKIRENWDAICKYEIDKLDRGIAIGNWLSELMIANKWSEKETKARAFSECRIPISTSALYLNLYVHRDVVHKARQKSDALANKEGRNPDFGVRQAQDAIREAGFGRKQGGERRSGTETPQLKALDKQPSIPKDMPKGTVVRTDDGMLFFQPDDGERVPLTVSGEPIKDKLPTDAKLRILIWRKAQKDIAKLSETKVQLAELEKRLLATIAGITFPSRMEAPKRTVVKMVYPGVITAPGITDKTKIAKGEMYVLVCG